MNDRTVWNSFTACILSGLMIVLSVFSCAGLAEARTASEDYSGDLAGYCHAIAEINYTPAVSGRLKAVRASKYLVLCKTDGRAIDLTLTEPVRSVEGPGHRFILVYGSRDQADDAVAWLRAQPGVLYAEHDAEVSSSESADEVVSFRSEGASLLNLGDFLALARRFGSGSRTVAVIDSGVSPHSLLAGRMPTLGYDYVDADDDPTNDLSGHGTHVAGIIADCTAGTPVWIYPVRVLNSSGRGKISNLVGAVLEAAEAGVDVINLSLETTDMSAALDDAIENAVECGATVVVAAGNHARDTSEVCPAHLDEEGVVVVGSAEATDGGYRRASYSNYGDSVDLYAFGSDINSCGIDGGFALQSGTSMAAAHVSGVCTLLGLTQKGLSPRMMERRLLEVCMGDALPILDATGLVPVSEGFSLRDIALCVGDTLKLPAAATPSTSHAGIVWSSSDEAVVSVATDGTLRANRPGTAELVARCLGFEDAIVSATVLEGEGAAMVFPAALTALADEALMGAGCRCVMLQDGIEVIGDRAFANCTNLQRLLLPDSLRSIGEDILRQSEQAVVICGEGSAGLAYAREHGLQYVVSEE